MDQGAFAKQFVDLLSQPDCTSKCPSKTKDKYHRPSDKNNQEINHGKYRISIGKAVGCGRIVIDNSGVSDNEIKRKHHPKITEISHKHVIFGQIYRFLKRY